MARKFGVEIEIAGGTADKRTIVAAIEAAGVRCVAEDYNHTRRGHWKIVSDGSLLGANAMEIVSPPLRGKRGQAQVATVVRAVRACGGNVNASCGLHVHVEAGDLTVEQLKNVAKLVTIHEQDFKHVLPASRHSSSWARWPSQIMVDGRGVALPVEQRVQRIDQVTSVAQLLNLWGRDRYRAVNFESLSRHTTVEFRMHSGTVDAEKINSWVALCTGLVRRAAVDYGIKTHWDSGQKRGWADFRRMGGKATVAYISSRRKYFEEQGQEAQAA